MAMYPISITMREEHWQRMEAHVQTGFPQEVCGLLAGERGLVSWVEPVSNIDRSTTHFRMDPREQLKTLLRIEAEGLHLVGVYHSHPQGPAVPSETDIMDAAYPEAASLIWSPLQDGWTCKAFAMKVEGPREIPIKILKKEL